MIKQPLSVEFVCLNFILVFCTLSFHIPHLRFRISCSTCYIFHTLYLILDVSYTIFYTSYFISHYLYAVFYHTSHNLISVILYPLSYTLYPTFYFHIKSLFYTFHSLYSMLHRDNLWVSMNFVIPQVEFHSPQSPMISHRANFRAPFFILQKK